MEKTTYQREIHQEDNRLTVVKVDFWSISNEKRSRVKKLTNQYLDSVTKILESEMSACDSAQVDKDQISLITEEQFNQMMKKYLESQERIKL